MKRHALLGVVLAAIATGARGDWTPVTADDGIHASYADAASIRRHGTIVSMVGLYNFTRPDLTLDGQPHQSTTVLREYDCAEHRVRLLSFTDHSERFGAGRVVSAAHGARPWQAIVTGGVDDAFWRLACAPN